MTKLDMLLRIVFLSAFVASHSILPAFAQRAVQPQTALPGAPESAKTRALETGAKVLQSAAPLQPFDVYLSGFQPMKNRPDMQVEAHHASLLSPDERRLCAMYFVRLTEKRDKKMGISIAEKRSQRADLQQFVRPQSGVDGLKGKFGCQTPDIPGVVDKKNAGTRANISPAK